MMSLKLATLARAQGAPPPRHSTIIIPAFSAWTFLALPFIGSCLAFVGNPVKTFRGSELPLKKKGGNLEHQPCLKRNIIIDTSTDVVRQELDVIAAIPQSRCKWVTRNISIYLGSCLSTITVFFLVFRLNAVIQQWYTSEFSYVHHTESTITVNSEGCWRFIFSYPYRVWQGPKIVIPIVAPPQMYNTCK